MCAYKYQELDGFSIINDSSFFHLGNSQKEVTEHTGHMEHFNQNLEFIIEVSDKRPSP